MLQWDDPFGSVSGPPGAQRDIVLLVFDAEGDLIDVTPETEVGGDPLQYSIIGPGLFRFAIGICGGSNPPPQMKYIGFPALEILDFATDSPTSFGHPNMPLTAGVGASFFAETPQFGISPPVLETFSSAGGTPVLFDEDGTRKATPEVRQQPRFVGVDRTSNTFFGEPGTPFHFRGK